MVDIKTVVDVREAQHEGVATVPEAFDHPTHGLVGPHLMFRHV